jgi:hypothetical protein
MRSASGSERNGSRSATIRSDSRQQFQNNCSGSVNQWSPPTRSRPPLQLQSGRDITIKEKRARPEGRARAMNTLHTTSWFEVGPATRTRPARYHVSEDAEPANVRSHRIQTIGSPVTACCVPSFQPKGSMTRSPATSESNEMNLCIGGRLPAAHDPTRQKSARESHGVCWVGQRQSSDFTVTTNSLGQTRTLGWVRTDANLFLSEPWPEAPIGI